jgi:hypothetical protein
MPILTPRACATCLDAVCEVNRSRCYRCLHPERPAPRCDCCGSHDYYVSGFCRRCHPRLGVTESCRSCLGWITVRVRGMCNPCYQFAQRHPAGACATCRRQVAVLQEVCRMCRIQASYTAQGRELVDLAAAARTGHQLALLDVAIRPASRLRTHDRPPPAPPWRQPAWVQLRMFDPPRNMNLLRQRTNPEVADPVFAAQVLGELDRYAIAHGWPVSTRVRLRWSIGLLVTVHRADEPIKASTVLGFDGEGNGLAHALRFLTSLGLLDDDRPDVIAAWIERKLADVHPDIRAETEVWIQILRHGDPRRRPRADGTVRLNIYATAPFLVAMSAKYSTLRAVTTQDITGWLAGRRGAVRDLSCIRDLFKTMKRARMVFADPARSLGPGRIQSSTPLPLAPDVLRAVGRAASADPVLRMVVALIGIHGMTPKQARELPLTAIDVTADRLIHNRFDRPLDDYTRDAFRDYRRRHRLQWPATFNPYLLVNQVSAYTERPVTNTWLLKLFADLPITPDRLRVDRFLDEAVYCGGDPLHLVAVFNINPGTGMRYSKAVTDRIGTTINER